MTRPMNRKAGLRRKVLLGILLVGLLPIWGGILVIVFSAPDLLQRLSGERFEEAARQTATSLHLILEREVHHAETLALNATVRHAITTMGDPLARLKAVEFFKEYQTLNAGEALEIALFNRNGTLVAATAPPSLLKVTGLDPRGTTISRPLYHPDQQRYHLTITQPVKTERTKETFGWVQFTINAKGILDLIGSVKIGRTGHAMLIAEDELVFCPLLAPASHTQMIWTSTIVGPQERGWAVARDNGHGATRSLMGFAPLHLRSQAAPRPWSVVVTQDRREMSQPLDALVSALIGWGGVVVVLTLVAGLVALRHLVAPVQVLERGAEEIGKGNLDHRIRIRAGDELHDLAEAFNRMAERLKQSLTELRRTERQAALNTFYATLVHDLKTPMVGIHNTLTLMQTRKDLDHPTQKMVQEMLCGTGTFLGIINDLLDVYYHHYADLSLWITHFSLAEAIEEVLNELHPQRQERRLEIEVVTQDRRMWYRGDRRRLQRVFRNLLDNAIRYSPTGGKIAVLLEYEQTETGQSLVGRVEDQGPGIPPGELTRIFDLLHRAGDQEPAAIQDRPGRGLGLYLCKIVVEAHGGTIAAENRPGGGAAFWIRLPVKEAADPHRVTDRGRPEAVPTESPRPA